MPFITFEMNDLPREGIYRAENFNLPARVVTPLPYLSLLFPMNIYDRDERGADDESFGAKLPLLVATSRRRDDARVIGLSRE